MNKKISMAARLLLGAIYFIFGLNGFLQFLPQPPLPESAMGFIVALVSSGFFLPLLKATEVLAGLLLVIGVAAPLALVILAPITLQIFCFHLFLTPGAQNVILPVVMILLHLLAAMAYWPLYLPLFKKRG